MSSPPATIRPELLALLQCPQTGEPLVVVEAEELAKINSAMSEGNFRTPDGERLRGPWSGAVAARPSSNYYPIVAGAVALLASESGSIVAASPAPST